jgi:ABC-type molybdate transport system substrate-binding protein
MRPRVIFALALLFTFASAASAQELRVAAAGDLQFALKDLARQYQQHSGNKVSLSLYDHLSPKLVFGENISQTAQFVQSGNAQAGIVAHSLALSPAMKDGLRWEIPAELYPPIEQALVVLKSSPNKAAARAFLEFLRTSEAQAALAHYGFTLHPEIAPRVNTP